MSNCLRISKTLLFTASLSMPLFYAEAAFSQAPDNSGKPALPLESEPVQAAPVKPVIELPSWPSDEKAREKYKQNNPFDPVVALSRQLQKVHQEFQKNLSRLPAKEAIEKCEADLSKINNAYPMQSVPDPIISKLEDEIKSEGFRIKEWGSVEDGMKRAIRLDYQSLADSDKVPPELKAFANLKEKEIRLSSYIEEEAPSPDQYADLFLASAEFLMRNRNSEFDPQIKSFLAFSLTSEIPSDAKEDVILTKKWLEKFIEEQKLKEEQAGTEFPEAAEKYVKGATILLGIYNQLPMNDPILVIKVNRAFEDNCSQGDVEICLSQAKEEGRLNEARTYLAGRCNSGEGGACRAAVSLLEGAFKNQRKAYLDKGCSAGDALSCLELENAGSGPISPENEKNLNLYRKACAGGDADSCEKVGVFYAEHKEMPHSQWEATKFFQYGCDLGNMKACSAYGANALNGIGMMKSVPAALDAYYKICNKNGCDESWKDTELLLAACQRGDDAGWGCAELAKELFKDPNSNKEAAVGYLEKACELSGNPITFFEVIGEREDAYSKIKTAQESCSVLAKMYEKGNGVDKSLQKALSFYEKEPDPSLENKTAYINLLMKEPELAVNPERASEIIESSCSEGFSKACRYLFTEEAKKKNLKIDGPAMVEKLKQECRYGFGSACFSLGTLTINGIGVPQSFQRGVRLYERGCTANFGKTCNSAGVRLFQGKEVPKEVQKGLQLMEKGCTLNDASACYNIGAYLTKTDKEKADKYFEAACKLGHAKSCELLKK